MDELKQVKVDNWGIYFLQRLKHFFNRTDYCDLTLQFQDKAQLKVHRLVLSACTEYFELLERTCEMYEDCLVMPDDLQADVVVPIINFMYTGHLEFNMEILEKLYQTSLVMNMPVLTKLLEAHRTPVLNIKPPFSKKYSKNFKSRINPVTKIVNTPNSQASKRTYGVMLENSNAEASAQNVVIPSAQNTIPPANVNRMKMVVSQDPVTKALSINKYGMSPYYNKKLVRGEPKPTRCELPEELESDENAFVNSFMNISYDSKPLVVHPDATKADAKRKNIFIKASGSKTESSAEILECKKVTRTCSLFDEQLDIPEEYEIPSASITNIPRKSAAQLFDQIVTENQANESYNKPRVTIETTDSKQAANLDHAKIISEVLKKYPHLVNSNKNIKLKVLNTNTVCQNSSLSPKIPSPSRSSVKQKSASQVSSTEEDKIEYINRDFIDTKEAARLIGMGVENISGPWICLMCGTPTKALRFGSYYYYRRHLVEVHNEKPATKMCEYCGMRIPKRNVLVHHLLVKHGIEPPMQYSFPRCNICDYIGLTEAFLVKHKLSHDLKSFKCNVCNKKFTSTNQLLAHIQQTGHKFTGEKKADLKCIYCLRVFMREGNLYSHIKHNHKQNAIRDGVIDDSDEEKQDNIMIKKESLSVKHEAQYSSDYEEEAQEYAAQKLLRKKPVQKILNFPSSQVYQTKQIGKPDTVQILNKQTILPDEYTTSSIEDEDLVNIDGEDYYVHNNQLIKYVGNNKRRKPNEPSEEYVLSDISSNQDFIIQHEIDNQPHYLETMQMPAHVPKKITTSQQQMQIVVANDDEYANLMTSNTTAIYEDGTSKTLTVLTTPDTATLTSAGIDIQEAQPNSMMIIQNDYPLGGTSVTEENSNIMVVYSQPEDNLNKSYQVITAGNETQLIQNALVSSNHYETTTAVVPASNIHLQNSIPLQEIDNADKPTLPNMSQVQTIVASDVDIEHEEIHSLPEVSLPEEEVTHTMEVTQDEVEMSPTYTQDDTQVHETIEDNVSQTEDNLEESLVQAPEESEAIATMENVESTPQIGENEVVPDNTASLQDEIEYNQTENQNVNTTDPVPEIIQSDLTPEKEIATEISQETSDKEHEEENIETIETAVEKEEIPEVVKEKIQTLTSEWSEDESEVITQEPVVPVENEVEVDQELKDDQPEVCNDTETVIEPGDELEESIENIQKVMALHMTQNEVVQKETKELETAEDVVQSEIAPEAQSDCAKPQEKLSSLLNDWEDTESQEETNGEENANENGNTHDDVIKEKLHESQDSEVTDAPKDDKLKSLVSDWDEEEEETNNKT